MKPRALSLTEVEVFGKAASSTGSNSSSSNLSQPIEGIGNLTKGKKAKQSSDWNPMYAGAAKAIDGNKNGYFRVGSMQNTITHTKDELNPWWEVDLGANYAVNTVVLYNRMDGCCWDRLQDFYIVISETPFTNSNTTVLPSKSVRYGPFSPWDASKKEYKLRNLDANGRYVRIYLKNNGKARPLSLTEVEIFSK